MIMYTLHDDKQHSSNDWNKVEWQIHEVSDDGRGAELLKGTLDDLAQFCHGVIASLDLSTLLHNTGIVASHQRSIKGIEESILKEPISRDDVNNCRALVQDEHHRGEHSQGTVNENEDGKLWEVGEEEHSSHHAY